jgi:hypothetical protein
VKLHALVLHQSALKSDGSMQTLPPIKYLLLSASFSCFFPYTL